MGTWQHWANLILGVWVIISGFVNYSSFFLASSLTLTGLAIATLAIWGALEQSTIRKRPTLHI